MGHLSLL